MIIIKNHFNEKDTVIYGDVVSHGYETFYISKLDKICNQFEWSEEIKQQIIRCHKENQGVDDMLSNILDILKAENNDTLNHAVALATENDELLDGLMSFFNNDLKLKIIIANRKKLSQKLIKELAKDTNFNVKDFIARRLDLDYSLIKELAMDEDILIRCTIIQRSDIGEGGFNQTIC